MVRFTIGLLPCLVVLPLTGCMDLGSCTLNIEPGVEVAVRDLTTQEHLATTPRGVVREGAYEDSLEIWSVTADVPPRVITLVGADEREGIYSVHVEAEGYEAWDTSGVRVTGDDCHVRTARFTAAMSSVP
jgi:hypothetical protein